ncbi:MAG: GxxExxY protein [Blastocatellia bacterium]|nr:GxxExxY protein [Blastocatellia bacterium]
MTDLLYKDECYAILGACFQVYKDKGCGFLEAVYQECLAIEFECSGVLFVPQPELELFYRGRKLTQMYRPDFVCVGTIIVELKAVQKLSGEHRAQTMNYLKATGMKLGLLVNFGHYPKLEYERIAFSQSPKSF